jgi:dTDP-4-amino-4,6-dideoxygalactose transaminase
MYRGLPSAHRDNLPVASAAAQKVLCLPIYPALADADVERIADAIREGAER